MQLDPAEKRSVWWGGAFKGALKGIPLGLGVGFAAAAVLSLALPVLAPSLVPIFASFLTVPGYSFMPIPLMIFNTALTMMANAISSGNAAVVTHHQNKHNIMYDARISALEGREQVLEEALSTSQTVKKILAQGPANAHSFTESLEESRNHDMSADKSPTIH